MDRRLSVLPALAMVVWALTPPIGAASAPAEDRTLLKSWLVTGQISIDNDDVEGNGVSGDEGPCSISGSGRYVAFLSAASNLVVGDTNGVDDAFVRDRDLGRTERVSVSTAGTEANSWTTAVSISGNGRYVAFQSRASNLVPDDTNALWDVFVRDLVMDTTERVSVSSSGAEGNGSSDSPSLSHDGRYVAFSSNSTNLVDGDTDEHKDVFVHDRVLGVTERISVASSGSEANYDAEHGAISGNGRFVAFTSFASNLVADDANRKTDVFVHDRVSDVTERVSVSSAAVEANNDSYRPSVSDDGRYVAFESYASNLVAEDINKAKDVFVHDRVHGTTESVSTSSSDEAADEDAYGASLSGDGLHIAFTSSAANLVADDTNDAPDVFVRNRLLGTTERASVSSLGLQASAGSNQPSISGDGSAVSFHSWARDLVVVDSNRSADVFVSQLVVFADIARSLFEADVEWLAEAGITRGCNAPYNTMFCPQQPVTRGQMAAFLVRALGYVDDGGGNLFLDDDESIFATDIDKLGTAGLTRGCNPPTNDRFCPDDKVTRGEMAAFLVRALGYIDAGAGDLFGDDDDSIFEADIEKLATAGVTLGCNPPINDAFCPGANVTREQMAAFLHRALG